MGKGSPLGVVGRNRNRGVDLQTEVLQKNLGKDEVTVLDKIADGGVAVHRELADSIPIAQPERCSRRRSHMVPGNVTLLPAKRGPLSRVSRINCTSIPGGCNTSDGGYHIRNFGFGNNNLFTVINNLVSFLSVPGRSFSDIRKNLTNKRINLR